MKRRIAIWAVVGFLVAGFWAVYAGLTSPNPLTSNHPIWNLINITCPIAFASVHFHFGIKLYWVLLANAATYGLLGLVVETFRQQFSHAQ